MQIFFQKVMLNYSYKQLLHFLKDKKAKFQIQLLLTKAIFFKK